MAKRYFEMMMAEKAEMAVDMVLAEIDGAFDLDKVGNMDRWNGLSKQEMLEWILDRKCAIDTLINGLHGVGLLTSDSNLLKVSRDRYLQACKAVKAAVKQAETKDDTNLIDKDYIELKVMAALTDWTVGDMGATEALVKVETLIDDLNRKYDFAARGMAHDVNAIVAGHEESILQAVKTGYEKLYMPLKHIRLLVKHGMYIKVEDNRVYASASLVHAEWDDMTDMSYSEIREWLGY